MTKLLVLPIFALLILPSLALSQSLADVCLEAYADVPEACSQHNLDLVDKVEKAYLRCSTNSVQDCTELHSILGSHCVEGRDGPFGDCDFPYGLVGHGPAAREFMRNR